ncbi:unnamed protein product [Cyprideis torosa]|uniref:Uncharacterized protein n=1 Tax=Cyprideis torosa TaxID=163714 RepID=A0A7R8WST3_9CRUS|nr:unnamed protein product [Cyprideis torosa]CAG0908436.1 unnamed protein product [Cyprideis torosa]
MDLKENLTDQVASVMESVYKEQQDANEKSDWREVLTMENSLEASSQVLPYFPGHSYGDNETAVTIDGSSGTLPVEGFKKPSRSSNDGKEPENESCIQGGERNDSTEAAGDYLDIPDFDDQLENQTNLLKTEEPVFIPP